MSVWNRWLKHPRDFWVRKALFQVHLWTGIALGLYIVVMSLTGVILVYGRSLSYWTSTQSKFVTITSHRLSVDDLEQIASRDYPGYQVQGVYQSRNRSRPVEILMIQGASGMERIFNPYTGADMGPTVTTGAKIVNWIIRLHDNLLFPEETGRKINAAGGIVVLLVAISGLIIWWPGTGKWRRSLGIEFRSGLKKFNWSLHSAVGIWSILFIFMWGLSGIYLSIPTVFNDVANYFDPNDGKTRKLNFSDQFLDWLARLHFGRFGGLSIEIIWTIFGLVPVVLFLTGAFMWWSRVLSPWPKRSAQRRLEMHEDNSPQRQSSLRA